MTVLATRVAAASIVEAAPLALAGLAALALVVGAAVIVVRRRRPALELRKLDAARPGATSRLSPARSVTLRRDPKLPSPRREALSKRCCAGWGSRTASTAPRKPATWPPMTARLRPRWRPPIGRSAKTPTGSRRRALTSYRDVLDPCSKTPGR